MVTTQWQVTIDLANGTSNIEARAQFLGQNHMRGPNADTPSGRGGRVVRDPAGAIRNYRIARLASHCWGSIPGSQHYGANAVLSSKPASKGITGLMDHFAANPFDWQTTAIVHPTQIVMDSGDFIGWGTATGAGVDNCPNVNSNRWSLYIDGMTFGTYFCRQGAYGSTSATAQDQRFEIIHTSCSGLTRWRVSWNGTQKDCQLVNGAGGTPDVGGESIAHDPQRIDIGYQRTQYRILGGTWTNWPAGADSCANLPFYGISGNGTTTWVPVQL